MRFLGRLAIILIVALGAAVAHSTQWPIIRDVADARQRRDASTGDETPVNPPIGTSEADPQALPDYYISVERAYQYWDEGMPFIDARTDAERVVGTIQGAFHLETRDFISGMSAGVLDQIDRAFPVVVFCAGGECDASENVAQRLIGRGYSEVYVMYEGFGAWQEAGHPTEPVGGG